MGMYDCEKCLHEEMCDQPSRHLWGTLNGEKECSDFKDRNNYVEVVRCKDCVNYCGFEHCKNGICDVDSVSKRAVYPNDFCSYGEKREV